MLEGILVGIIDASLLRKAMQSCSDVDRDPCACAKDIGFAPSLTFYSTTIVSPNTSSWVAAGTKKAFSDAGMSSLTPSRISARKATAGEEDEARAEDASPILTYPSSSFDRERMVALIKSEGKRELMREARIAMRTINTKGSAG